MRGPILFVDPSPDNMLRDRYLLYHLTNCFYLALQDNDGLGEIIRFVGLFAESELR